MWLRSVAMTDDGIFPTYAERCGHWETPNLSAGHLATLREMANAASPAPWRRTGTDVFAWVAARYRAIFPGRSGDEAGRNVADQNFVVAARVMVVPMIDEIASLRRQVVAAEDHAREVERLATATSERLNAMILSHSLCATPEGIMPVDLLTIDEATATLAVLAGMEPGAAITDAVEKLARISHG